MYKQASTVMFLTVTLFAGLAIAGLNPYFGRPIATDDPGRQGLMIVTQEPKQPEKAPATKLNEPKEYITVDLGNKTTLKMVLIPTGELGWAAKGQTSLLLKLLALKLEAVCGKTPVSILGIVLGLQSHSTLACQRLRLAN